MQEHKLLAENGNPSSLENSSGQDASQTKQEAPDVEQTNPSGATGGITPKVPSDAGPAKQPQTKSRKSKPKRAGEMPATPGAPATTQAQQDSVGAKAAPADSGGSPQIVDPFADVHQTLARPIEAGPVGRKVVPFKVLVQRRPPKGRWCTIHPDPEYRMVVSLLVFDRDDVYLVHPSIASEVESQDVHRRAMIYTGILRPNCTPFLWYVPVPQAGERDNDYWASARTAAEAGMGQWIRLSSDMDAKCYHYEPADLHVWPVQWPNVAFGELLRRGFQHPGRFIDTMDHPVLRELYGQAGPIS
jgi:hypothetical protein